MTSPEPLSVTWGGPEWYLTDAQFSVVAMMDTGGVQVLERVRYDPYGNAEHLDMADFNGNGEVTVQDLFDHQAAYFGGDLMGDFNRNGAFTTQDLFDFQAAYFGASSRPATPHGSSWVSHPDAAGGGSDSVVGYCGYLFNHETGDYTVRFRHYSPALGRWFERDPAGYVDGSSTLAYVSASPIILVDPLGLTPNDWFDLPKNGPGWKEFTDWLENNKQCAGVRGDAHQSREGLWHAYYEWFESEGRRHWSGDENADAKEKLIERLKKLVKDDPDYFEPEKGSRKPRLPDGGDVEGGRRGRGKGQWGKGTLWIVAMVVLLNDTADALAAQSPCRKYFKMVSEMRNGTLGSCSEHTLELLKEQCRDTPAKNGSVGQWEGLNAAHVEAIEACRNYNCPPSSQAGCDGAKDDE